MYSFGARGRRGSGIVLGLLAVLGFSFTLPLTRLALPSFGALGLTALRAAIAGVVAAAILLASPGRRPTRAELRGLLVVGLGTVVGFPTFAALSMGRVNAGHGAVVVALVPLLTALAGSYLAGERPSSRFWAASLAGTFTVVAFALRRGGGSLGFADVLLALGAVSAAVGYAMGGVLAKALGGTRVTCWSLVVCLPLSVPAAAWTLRAGPPVAPGTAWVALGYLALVSQLTAFFAWNRALATGGIAAVSQTQLLQCFFTLTASAVILHERIESELFGFACLVVACVFVSRLRPKPKGVPA
ncbi:MAG TPA: DMT family transporter [Polyangiaceae bacterium]|nr:DMT family transporter [Polyangiaceae bacterium]